MKSTRQNILSILGAVAMISAVVFGSGAFTTVEVDRDVSVTVDQDAEAAIALLNTTQTSELVDDGDGDSSQDQIEFDFSGDGGGVNANSTVRFGEGSLDSNLGDGEVGAFKIVNNDSTAYNITVKATDTTNPTTLFGNHTADEETDSGTTIEFNDVNQDDEIQVALEIDTADNANNYSGNITVTAERTT